MKSQIHSYRHSTGCMVCGTCGTAKHKKAFEGFKYWYAGVGSNVEPKCKINQAIQENR